MSQETIHKANPEQLADILEDICNAAISTSSIQPTFVPEKQLIQIHLSTNDRNASIPLNKPEKLLEFTRLNENNEIIIFITAWKFNASQENDALTKLQKAYHCRGKGNLIVINFGDQIHSLQTWLSVNNEQLGQWMGEFITELSTNVSISKIHLIGHGVGAHIAGAAARKFIETTGNLLPRITALDPAMLCYKESQAITGLQKGDAAFVDVIHTSAYGLGKAEPIGDVDFFPNGPSTLQPGCNDLVCSHNQAIEYFAETVLPGNEDSFLGQKCNSIKNLNSNVCQQQQIPMGIATPRNAKGNYFLKTKNVSPYGNNPSSRVGASVPCLKP